LIIPNNNSTTEPSFTLKNRILRALWGMVWVVFFRYSPRPFHTWRALILKLFGAKLGLHAHVYPDVSIWAPWLLTVGNNVGIADGVKIYNIAKVEISDYCVVSQGAYLCTGSHDINSKNFQLIAKPIVLEKYVWICAEAFVGPGVSVAEGCVLGARGVLIKPVTQAWGVWIGNPAEFKKLRQPNIKLENKKV